MAIIRKKCWPELFELVESGKKRFDIRVADFDIKESDTLILEEWDPETKEYTGRTIKKRVGYILKLTLDQFGQKELVEKEGLYAIQLES